MVWLLSSAVALLLAGLGVLLRRHALERRANERLHTRLLDRDRRVRQLHDTLLQGMQGLILRFQAISERLPEPDETRGSLQAALRRADQVLVEARDGVHALQQGDAAEGALARALDEAGQELAGGNDTRFSVRIEGVPRPLVPAVQDEARQIMSEALLNAFRHAGACTIEVRLRYGALRFGVGVRDDGVGMDRALLRRGLPGHWGMAGMRERAQCIAARLSWHSTRGAGTSVHLTLPAHRAYLRS